MGHMYSGCTHLHLPLQVSDALARQQQLLLCGAARGLQGLLGLAEGALNQRRLHQRRRALPAHLLQLLLEGLLSLRCDRAVRLCNTALEEFCRLPAGLLDSKSCTQPAAPSLRTSSSCCLKVSSACGASGCVQLCDADRGIKILAAFEEFCRLPAGLLNTRSSSQPALSNSSEPGRWHQCGHAPPCLAVADWAPCSCRPRSWAVGQWLKMLRFLPLSGISEATETSTSYKGVSQICAAPDPVGSMSYLSIASNVSSDFFLR